MAEVPYTAVSAGVETSAAAMESSFEACVVACFAASVVGVVVPVVVVVLLAAVLAAVVTAGLAAYLHSVAEYAYVFDAAASSAAGTVPALHSLACSPPRVAAAVAVVDETYLNIYSAVR